MTSKTFHFPPTCAGNQNEFQRLLMDGTNLNAMDRYGDTALLLAAKRGEHLSEKCRRRNEKNLQQFFLATLK